MSLRLIAVLVTTLACAAATNGLGQTGAATSPAFEVVSIRPSGPNSPLRGSRGGPGSRGPERFEFYQATTLDLISTAWDVDRFQISSKADLERDRFDVDAKVPAGATRDEFRLMLQNMLAERLGLRVHVEQRDFPAYALRVAKSGLRIKEAEEKAGALGEPGSDGHTVSTVETPRFVFNQSVSGSFKVVSVEAHLEPMSALVRYLPKPDGMPVVDETALAGRYNFTLDYSEDLPGPSDLSAPPAPSITTELRQLGLELVRTKAPFKVVVVESLNREPTPN